MLQMLRFAKSKTASATAIAAVTVLTVLGSILPNNFHKSVQAESCVNPPQAPQFNVYPLTFADSHNDCKDYPLIRMKKVGGIYPQNEAEMNAGVTGQNGDVFYVTMYVHNGASDTLAQSITTAKNTKLTTTVSSETGTTHTIKALVSADNAIDAVDQTYKITTGPNEHLEVVPNSGERFDSAGNQNESGFALGNNTVSLGDFQACFTYSRFYRFQVKVVSNTPTPQGQLSITKEVRNITTNGAFSHIASAYQNDTMEYRIMVKSTSATPVKNVVVTDGFNSQLSFVSGTLTVNGTASQPGLTSGGLTFASVDQTGLDIRYQAKVLASTGTVTNTAMAVGDGATKVQDTANVTVSTPQPQNTTLSITKEVRNVNTSGSFTTSATAELNDKVEYRIRVTNTGSVTAKNVVVNDSLSGTGINPTGTITVDRSYTGTFANGLQLGDLNTGATVTITYQATVTKDSITVTNTASAIASNAPQVQASARVDVAVPSKGNLTISKQVRRLDGSFQKSVTVDNNATVEYQIVVGVNSGRVQNVVLTDSLPSGVTYQTGTLRVDGAASGDNVNTINLGTMSIGQSKTVIFRATVTAPANVATTTLTNTAKAVGDNVSPVQDTASVVINQVVGTPNLAITKNVRNVTQNTSFQKNVTVNNGDEINYEIVVSNPGSREVTNVVVNDTWNGNITISNARVLEGGSASISNGTTGSFQINVGTLASGQSRRIVVLGTVTYSGTGTFNLTNTASASGTGVTTVQDSASINASVTGQANLVFSKKAWNDTKNVDATSTPAAREDYITYTLTVKNTGNKAADNFVITDDISGVLPFADITDNGGATIANNVITYPAITIPANGSVSKSFKVRVKYSLAPNLTFTMVNTYGNTVQVQITTPAPVPPITAPKTGAGTAALGFGGLSTAAYAAWMKRKSLLKLILA